MDELGSDIFCLGGVYWGSFGGSTGGCTGELGVYWEIWGGWGVIWGVYLGGGALLSTPIE
uniref:Uncharacterized protein n=1 Tax=Meloidogyne enterolobii TaxID=390850 RepID=A0A6V7XLM0_MELEN|nr:unnamed protein product [Meloidogyne enterolobii]